MIEDIQCFLLRSVIASVLCIRNSMVQMSKQVRQRSTRTDALKILPYISHQREICDIFASCLLLSCFSFPQCASLYLDSSISLGQRNSPQAYYDRSRCNGLVMVTLNFTTRIVRFGEINLTTMLRIVCGDQYSDVTCGKQG